MISAVFIAILGMLSVSCYCYLHNISLPNIYAIQQQSGQEEDFILEVHNVSSSPVVTKFSIKNEVYDQICNLGKCSIEYNPYSSVTFSLPDDNYPFMYYLFQFTINYNNTSNLESTPTNGIVDNLQGHSIKFLSGESTCHIDFHKSVLNADQQTYYCEDDGIDTSITRIYDNKQWNYDAIEKYDAELDIFSLNGTFRN